MLTGDSDLDGVCGIHVDARAAHEQEQILLSIRRVRADAACPLIPAQHPLRRQVSSAVAPLPPLGRRQEHDIKRAISGCHADVEAAGAADGLQQLRSAERDAGCADGEAR